MSEVSAVSEKKVTRMDLFKAWWKWTLAVEVPVSFDRMQALAFSYSLNKILQKIYKDDSEEQRAMGNEENTPEMMESLKIGLMGPLAGIGDSVDQGIVATIPLAIFVPMALEGSVVAAFIPGLIYLAWSYGWSWFLFNKGYSLGKNSVMTILQSGAIKKVIDIASIVGLFMIGCLSAAYVKFETILEFVSNTEKVSVQEILNGIILVTMALAILLTFFGII